MWLPFGGIVCPFHGLLVVHPTGWWHGSSPPVAYTGGIGMPGPLWWAWLAGLQVTRCGAFSWQAGQHPSTTLLMGHREVVAVVVL